MLDLDLGLFYDAIQLRKAIKCRVHNHLGQDHEQGHTQDFLKGVPEAWTQKHLTPKCIFSSDLGHFIFEFGGK